VASPSTVSIARPFAIEREREAGKHRHAVDHHRAGAALAELATVLGSGEIHVLAQDFEKGLIRREGNLLRLAVDLQREMDVLRAGVLICPSSPVKPAPALAPDSPRANRRSRRPIGRRRAGTSAPSSSPRPALPRDQSRIARREFARLDPFRDERSHRALVGIAFADYRSRMPSGSASTSRCAVAPSSSSSVQCTCALNTERNLPAQEPGIERAALAAPCRRSSVRSWQNWKNLVLAAEVVVKIARGEIGFLGGSRACRSPKRQGAGTPGRRAQDVEPPRLILALDAPRQHFVRTAIQKLNHRSNSSAPGAGRQAPADQVRSLKRWIFPVAVFGNSERTRSSRGYLYARAGP